MTPTEEWIEFFGNQFPEGVLVTLVRGNEGNAHVDNSPQIVTSEIQVLGVEEDYPKILFIDPMTGRNFIFEVSAVEDREDGCFLETSSDTAPDLLMSSNLSEEAKQALKEA
jgi:hypothetical protein